LGGEERQRVVLVGTRAGEHPPAAAEAERRRVGVCALDERPLQLPLVWERGGPVEADGVRSERLRRHPDLAVPGEDVRIRKVEALAQDDPAVAPGETVLALR